MKLLPVVLSILMLLSGCTVSTDPSEDFSPEASPSASASPSPSASPSYTPDARPAPEDLYVNETAIWPRSDTYYEFVAVLTNPNTEYAWSDSYVDIYGIAADGTILNTAWDSFSLLPGRSVVVFGSLFTDGRAPVEIFLTGWNEPTFVGASTYCNVDVVRPSKEDASADTWVTGYVTSDCDGELKDVRIYALVRNTEGKLIFGGEGSVGIVRAETESYVELLLWGVRIPSSSTLELVSELGFQTKPWWVTPD